MIRELFEVVRREGETSWVKFGYENYEKTKS